MHQKLKIAIASTTSQVGDLDHNLHQIIVFARRAASNGAHLLLTPEMSATGYGNYPDVLALAEVAGDGPIYRALSQAAHETNVVLCAGFVESSGEQNHLSQYAIFPDGAFIAQRKHRLTRCEQPMEPQYPQLAPFGKDGTGTPSKTDFKVFKVNGVKCAIVICADAGIANLRSELASQGVRVVLLPTGAGGQREDRVDNGELQTRAGKEKYARLLETVFLPGQTAIVECLELRQALVAVNMGAWDKRQHFHLGHGMIINSRGEVPAFFHGQPNLDLQKPMYACADVDVDEFLVQEQYETQNK